MAKASRRIGRRDGARAGTVVQHDSSISPVSVRASLRPRLVNRALKPLKPWRYEFSENGGYDCMSNAYKIYEGDLLVATLDFADFGQTRSWHEAPGVKERVEMYASTIVAVMNAWLEAP